MSPLNVAGIEEARERIQSVVRKTPLEHSGRLSEKYQAQVYLKREDLQPVRSYKIRGAYNLIRSLSDDERKNGVVCASAGNHAQGVALSCKSLQTKGVIFMPGTTPKQKIHKVLSFGGDWIELKLVGKNFDESNALAKEYGEQNGMIFVHPFDDYRTMAGQGTIGPELLEQIQEPIDYLLVPIGGGGLAAGLSTYVAEKSRDTNIIGVEPAGAAAMHESIKAGRVVQLDNINTFVDGAAVKRVGEKTFEIVKTLLTDVVLVDEGKVCSTMIELYQSDGIITEPAGALSVAALDNVRDSIKGKVVVCIVSGGNNDLSRYPEIIEKSLVYEGLKHYFIIEFFQKPGELRMFLDKVLSGTDDITRFEYIKRTSKELGPALIGVEFSKQEDLEGFLARMNKQGIRYKQIESNDPLYNFLI